MLIRSLSFCLAGFCILGMTSCVHRNRVSKGALERLAKNNEKFVLVFGSLSTPKCVLTRPTIRFVHHTDHSAPEDLLCSLVIASGDRFYAVLKNPQGMSYVDTFDAEVGSAETAFDKITFSRLRERDAPLAMYFGEMEVRPARERVAQGQTVVVTTRDDFANAQAELKRLYPQLTATVRRAGFLRDPSAPQSPTPQRAR